LSTRTFNSVAMEDVYNCSIVQQCRMLEAELGTNVLTLCLNYLFNATQTVLNNKEQLLKKVFSNLPISAKGSASIASKISWRRLWDIALEKGVKGTKIIQSLFQEVCCPASCFQCLLCKSHVPSSTTCFEHACEQHPIQLQDLSRYLLVNTLSEGEADSVFFHLFKVGKLYIAVGTAL